MDRWGMLLLLASSLLACHDSPRSNPLDPELTPPVELSVVANGSTGTMLLSWTSYSGETPFAAYRVLRRVSGLGKVDTVATLSLQAQTTWQDSLVTQGQTYIYQVAVVNSAGLVVTSAWAVASALELTPVVLATAVDSRRATITVHWSSYLGPRFASYRVVRKTPDGGEAVVFATTDPTTTAYTDTGLAGNTSYRYRVEVVTTRQGTVQSREVTGQFHELVAFWPLEVSDEDVIRLDAGGDGILAAVVLRVKESWGGASQGFSATQVDVLPIDPQAGPGNPRPISDLPLLGNPIGVAMATRDDGSKFVAAYAFDPAGQSSTDWFGVPGAAEVVYPLSSANTIMSDPDGRQQRLCVLPYPAVWGGGLSLRGLGLSLAACGQRFLLAAGDTLYEISAEGGIRQIRIDPVGGVITDLRVWRPPSASRDRIGVCIPEKHQVLLGDAFSPAPGADLAITNLARKGQSLGPVLGGPAPGAFLYPLALAVGPDGCIYVLDAGNGRIQVFSPEGDYITRWGQAGSGSGEFDFTAIGLGPESLRGSIAVDDQGYIYVADPGNQRIQKFAP